MQVVGRDKGTDLLSKVPTPPKHLCEMAKKGYKEMGNLLAQAQRLKKYYLGTLEIYADAYAQWMWAVAEIKRKNAIEPGSGYVQVFKSNASNITAEMTVKKEAVSQMLQCCKLFGLDPKSEKELKSIGDPNQGSLFDEFNKALDKKWIP